MQRGSASAFDVIAHRTIESSEDIEDLEDAPSEELENAETEIVDEATAAQTISELEAEIEILRRLESLALKCGGVEEIESGKNFGIY